MLTLLLALSVSQAPLADDFTPPPMPSAEVSVTRAARLIPTTRPRAGMGTLWGRTATATAIGAAGVGLGVLLTGGVSVLGMAGGTVLGITAFALALPLGVGLGILGVALGAACFSDDFKRDFADALTVAGLTVPIGTALALVLLAIGFSPLLAVALPFMVATAATPFIVQVRKPMAGRIAAPVREEVPQTGIVFQL
jgi:hypothetical protein